MILFNNSHALINLIAINYLLIFELTNFCNYYYRGEGCGWQS